MGALEGLRVLELGQLIAGPFCGQLMGDHGAEIIKVEPPGIGDPMRGWGQGAPVWFPVIGRNKRSITLDLRKSEGQDLLMRLATEADFLIENFRPGTMERWGLGYDALRAINPRLIMIRVSGYGQSGPYAKRAGYGSIGEAMGGMRHLAGEPDRPPSRVGLSIGDALAATFACLGAMMALQVRHRTGEGQIVDSAIYEAVLAMMEATVAEYSVAGHVRSRTGAILPGIAPSNVYPTRNGEILIAANQDSVWRRLAVALERPELADDPRFATHDARGHNQALLDTIIAEWSATFDPSALLALLHEHGVPAGKIFTAADMFEDPQYAARQAVIQVAHPDFANLWMQNVAPRLSGTPGAVRWPAPALGADNEAVYGGLLGIAAAERQSLRDRHII